jgi:hypothetical protein
MEGEDDDFKLLNIQKEAAVSILNIAIKADESKFRIRNEENITALLREVREMREKKTVDADALPAPE